MKCFRKPCQFKRGAEEVLLELGAAILGARIVASHVGMPENQALAEQEDQDSPAPPLAPAA